MSVQGELSDLYDYLSGLVSQMPVSTVCLFTVTDGLSLRVYLCSLTLQF